jgi:hypothetical protein
MATAWHLLWPYSRCFSASFFGSSYCYATALMECITWILTWGPFSLYSWTKSNSWESVAFYNWNSHAVVSGRHTISKYKSLVHVFIYWYLFHVEQNLSWFHFHLTWKTVSISQCNLPGSCVLSEYGTYRYWTGKCYLSSRFHLSWSAEFKHRNISANAVHVCGDWQHLKGRWVKGERQSWILYKFRVNSPIAQQV